MSGQVNYIMGNLIFVRNFMNISIFKDSIQLVIRDILGHVLLDVLKQCQVTSSLRYK